MKHDLIMHFRVNHITGNLETRSKLSRARGGVTVKGELFLSGNRFHKTLSDVKIRWGVTICNPKENFCYALGRRYANEAIEKREYITENLDYDLALKVGHWIGLHAKNFQTMKINLPRVIEEIQKYPEMDLTKTGLYLLS